MRYSTSRAIIVDVNALVSEPMCQRSSMVAALAVESPEGSQCDFLIVVTATYRLLYVFVAIERRSRA